MAENRTKWIESQRESGGKQLKVAKASEFETLNLGKGTQASNVTQPIQQSRTQGLVANGSYNYSFKFSAYTLWINFSSHFEFI